MQKTINGKIIKINKNGYLYINGIKQSDREVNPLTPIAELTTDPDAIGLIRKYNAKYYVMVNP
jgi:hypothetical protein